VSSRQNTTSLLPLQTNTTIFFWWGKSSIGGGGKSSLFWAKHILLLAVQTMITVFVEVGGNIQMNFFAIKVMCPVTSSDVTY